MPGTSTIVKRIKNEWMNEWIERMPGTSTIVRRIQDEWMNEQLDCLELVQ